MVELDEETTVIAKGALWQNATSIFVKLLAFVYTIIIARFVVQEQVGLFYFALGIVGTVGIFADLGLTSAIMRYVPFYLGKKDYESAHKAVAIAIFFGTFLLFACSAATYFLAGSIASFFNNPPLEGVLSLLAVNLAIVQAYTISNTLLFSLKQVRASAIGGALQAALKLAFTLLLIFSLGASAQMLAIAFMASYVFSGFYLLFELRTHLGWMKKGTFFQLHDYLPMLRELIPFGIMVVGALAFATIVGYSDKLLLGYLLKENINGQIAIYSIATSLSSLASIFAGSIAGILFPVVSGLFGQGDGKKDYARVNKTSQTALKWMLFSSVPIVAFLAAFASPMLRILYGSAYEPGSISLALFALGMLIGSLGIVQRLALAGMRLVKIDLFCVAVAAIANIVLNVLLIPYFGINGSAFASLVSFAIMAWMNNYYAFKYFGFAFPKSAWKNLFAGALVFFILFAIQTTAYFYIINMPFPLGDGGIVFSVLDKFLKLAFLLVFFAAGSLIYLVLINLMCLFEHEDVQVFRQIFSKFGFPPWVSAFCVRLVFWNQKELH